MNNYIYKIKDTDDDFYSQIIQTNKEAKNIIEDAVDIWVENGEDNNLNADNVFACIETLLKINNINYEWIYFNDDNIIEY